MPLPRLFHVSEDPNIKIFVPRPSPAHFDKLHGDVVFAINDQLLHNYLLPRDCPRVTFYAKPTTTQLDQEKFLGHTSATFVVAVEKKWYKIIQKITLYCYEFPTDHFVVLDEEAGYYVSYHSETPLAIHPIRNVIPALSARNVEFRVLETLWPLAEEVAASTLAFSIIRMRNASPKNQKV